MPSSGTRWRLSRIALLIFRKLLPNSSRPRTAISRLRSSPACPGTCVPRGRGPFKSWEAGAYDALVTLKKLNKVIDWRLEKILYHSERYNGWGYHFRGLPSPYIWGGSTIQRRGKFVADCKFSSTTWDT